MRNIRVVCCCSLLFGAVTLALPPPAPAQFGVAITVAPPALPVYEQPLCPGPGYLWTPGYWAWGPDGYYWVPGTWELAPVGLLWTPGYWAWDDGAFAWNAGYWAPQVGFYGGILYGFGYMGAGYAGGYWNNGAFFYNRSVNNVASVTNITNVYEKTVVNNVSVNNVSYNGGDGGTTARPTAAEQAVAGAHHVAPTTAQVQQERAAGSNHELLASVNHGKPPIAATPKPGVFSGQGVLEAKAAAPYHPPTPAPSAKHANPPSGATAKPNTNPNEMAKPVQSPESNATERQKPSKPNETSRPAEPSEPKPPEPREPGNPPRQPSSQPPGKPEHPPKEQGKEMHRGASVIYLSGLTIRTKGSDVMA